MLAGDLHVIIKCSPNDLFIIGDLQVFDRFSYFWLSHKWFSSRERKWRLSLFQKNSRVFFKFLIFSNFSQLTAAVFLWILNIVWQSLSFPFIIARLEQSSPYNSWVMSNFHLRKRPIREILLTGFSSQVYASYTDSHYQFCERSVSTYTYKKPHVLKYCPC